LAQHLTPEQRKLLEVFEGKQSQLLAQVKSIREATNSLAQDRAELSAQQYDFELTQQRFQPKPILRMFSALWNLVLVSACAYLVLTA
jgi:hypothetical protein